MDAIIKVVLLTAAAVWLYMTLVFFLAWVRKNNAVVDIAWGGGFVLIALLSVLWTEGLTPRQGLVTVLVLVWGIRLAIYLYIRNRGRGEDFRYARWRQQWGKYFVIRSYVQVFILQGFLMLIIAYPIMLVNNRDAGGLGMWDGLGLLVWLLGFAFEAIGDYQMFKFKQNPQNKGQIMTRGLWAYTRHPNYFGETVMWWGVFLIAVNVDWGWTSIISPLLITFLLLRISGVTLLEDKYKNNVIYQEYKRRTPAFFPIKKRFL